MIALVLAAAGSFVLLALMFIPLERAFPARAQSILRPRVLTDACFLLGQYMVWNGVTLAVLVASQTSLGPIWKGPALPTALSAILAIVLGDTLVYWFHRACHRFDFLWRFHAVHHSAEHLDWVAAHREHPLDGICTQLCANLPAFLLGFQPAAIAGFITLRGLWAIFIHSNTRVPLGPLKWIFGAPEFHHWHHARAERTRHNFANIAPWLDWLFGTHHDAKQSSYAIGLTEGGAQRSYVAWLVRPFLR